MKRSPSGLDPSRRQIGITPWCPVIPGVASERGSSSVTTCETTGLQAPWGHNQGSERRRGFPQIGGSAAAPGPVLIRPWRASALDRALRRPRGFAAAEATVAGTVVGFLAALAFAIGMSHALGQRDTARAAEASATKRADQCADDLGHLARASAELDRNVRVHLAIDEDRCPCVCGGEP